MLGKLLKYEFKSTGRFMIVLYIAVLVVAVLTGLTLHGTDFFKGGTESPNLVGIIFISIYSILLLAMAILTVVMIILRFYNGMLQGEGYLMHTLPVPTWMLVASKAITAFVWQLAAVIVMLFSGFLFILSTGQWAELLNAIHNSQLWTLLNEHKGSITLFIVAAIIEIIYMTLLFYASMSIGGAAKKHKVLFSVLAFIVIVVIISIVSNCLNVGSISSLESGNVKESMVQVILVKSIIMECVYSVLLFIATVFCLKKKLNLE